MSKKVLLLNNSYEILAFISEKKAIRLIIKNKVDVISNWDDLIIWSSGYIKYPSIIKLKYFVHKRHSQLAFSRKAVFKRDKFSCQYCGKMLKSGHITMDHIIPRSLGGMSSFTNCVAACFMCNNKKGNKTLEQVNMKVLNKPIVPSGYLYHISEQENWHNDWTTFFGLNEEINQ